MQFFYKVGNFSSGYSSIHVMQAAGSPIVITYPSLDVTANGSTSITIQVYSGSWRMVSLQPNHLGNPDQP